jgi:hypothetical protein
VLRISVFLAREDSHLSQIVLVAKIKVCAALPDTMNQRIGQGCP